MGEPVVDVSRDEDKMGEKAASKPELEVSVSFGRFVNDSLSWEKWSAFSPNKYLEEVEKCATPGSVAEKKAYFEAHYKKITARRAELMDQAKQMEDDPLRSENQIGGDLAGNVGGAGAEFDVSNSYSSTEEVVKRETYLTSEVISTHEDDLKEDAGVNRESQRSISEGVNGEMGGRVDSPVSSKPEKAVAVKEEQEGTPLVESQDTGEISYNSDNEIGNAPKVKDEKAKLGHQKESKVTPMKQRNLTRMKKKQESPVTKASQVSTPTLSKPKPTSTSLSASRSSAKKGGSDSSLTRSKIFSTAENKKVAPMSLHASLSLDPTNSGPASLAMTRRSSIMEKMGDKDIVKRAFKTFQKNFNQPESPGEEKSSVPKQVPAKGTGPRVSTTMTPKENGGLLKAGGVDKRSAKAVPPFGLKSDARTEKRKEKLEEKSNAKEGVKTSLQSKSKEEKGVEMRNLRQSLNFKATPVPGVYRGPKMSKSTSDKEVSKK